MKNLSFQYYPPKILIILIIVMTIVMESVKSVLKGVPIDFAGILITLSTISVVAALFSVINTYFVWNWFFLLLGITKISGRYEGDLVSSFHVDDDPNKPSIRMHIELDIAQNLNSIKIFGKVGPKDNPKGKTSDFESDWAHLQKLENGKFVLEYRYSNQANLQHPWHKKYTLTSHTGFASLVFDPKTKTFDGHYFTYENRSTGNIELTRKTT